MISEVLIRTKCRACALALGGQAPILGSIKGVFVTEQEMLGEGRRISVHQNTPGILFTGSGKFACPKHGRTLDLSKEPK